MKNLKIYQIIFSLIFLLFIVDINISRSATWTGPSGNPPENNVMAPLNQGTTPQFKNSGLHIGDDTTMEGYMFSVSNGSSYFKGNLEVGENTIIKADTGNLETEANLILQGGNLSIEDGLISISKTSNQLTLRSDKISMVTIDGGPSISIQNTHPSINSVSIAASIPNGTAIYGNTVEGIGILGIASGNGGIGVVGSSTNSNALAGRFDGVVRFNPDNSFGSFSYGAFMEINGGTASFENTNGQSIIITPQSVSVDGGDIIVESGDIEVQTGNIDMFSNNIINLAYPLNNSDAANKKYVDDQIGGAAIWERGSGSDIYYTGNVGIGVTEPNTALDILGQLSIGCVDETSDDPENSIRIGDAGFIYDSSCDSGTCDPGTGQCNSTLHMDATEGIIIQSDDFLALRGGGSGTNPGNYGIYINDEGNVGIGSTNPSEKLEVNDNVKINGGDLLLADISGQVTTELKSYNNAGSLWIIQPNSPKLVLADALQWDRSMSFQYVPGDTGLAAGRLTIGQINKNSDSYTHGITSLYTNGLERLRINSSGNVGIGTNSPSSNLHIYSSGSNSGVTDMNLEYDFTGPTNGHQKSNWILRADSNGGSFRIVNSNNERLIINSSGNVGIGTTNPAAKLHVDGNTKINSGLEVNGTITAGDDIILGENKVKKGAGTSPSIYFDTNNNVVITIP